MVLPSPGVPSACLRAFSERERRAVARTVARGARRQRGGRGASRYHYDARRWQQAVLRGMLQDINNVIVCMQVSVSFVT